MKLMRVECEGEGRTKKKENVRLKVVQKVEAANNCVRVGEKRRRGRKEGNKSRKRREQSRKRGKGKDSRRNKKDKTRKHSRRKNRREKKTKEEDQKTRISVFRKEDKRRRPERIYNLQCWV